MKKEPARVQELNPRQKEAALHTRGPLLIVAGAGAGKTKTITHRIQNLIESGVRADKILAVTFTNKAAKEMRDRISYQLIANSGQLPFVSTFHSLGVHIIKENARLLGLTRYFTILDESDSASMIKESLKELDLDPKQYDPRWLRNMISREKGRFVEPEEFAHKAEGTIQKVAARVWLAYEARKAKENSLDFDDLLLKAVKLLKENESMRSVYQDRWEYIHIDEYQDTNEVQYLMTKLLVGENKNICVVGDADQCLVAGTKITMADGTLKPIEAVKTGDAVLSNYGSGDFRSSKVIRRRKLRFKGDLIKIETSKGKTITSTPEHVHFAGYRLGLTPQLYLNYLMYKKGVGFRIGTTSVYTKGQRVSIVGFVQRSNQEHADAVWVIATHLTEQAARMQEYIFSLKYQIPTLPFVPRKGLSVHGYVHDDTALKKIFSSLDTEISGHKLLSDIGLSRDYPHHQPQTRNANRRNIHITLCADRRGKTPMHLISMLGNDSSGRKILESRGFSIRSAKKNTKTWRFETVYADYGKTCLLAAKVASAFPEANMIFNARLGEMKVNRGKNSLPCIPASSIMPGMALFTESGYDTVAKISRIPASETEVFDLNVEKTHNFIANGILTHNCIYSWRGANLKNILHFEKDYPNAKIIMLEENYRSTQNILEAANVVIKKNKLRPERNLFTKNQTGEKIRLYEALDEMDEADFVATKILEILDSFTSAQEENVASEIAILYRANFQSRVLEEAMLRYNIPYQVVGVKFFERKEIKDTLAYLRAALNPESLADIKRVINFPARGIGKVTLVKLFAGFKETLPVKTRLKIDSFYELLEDIRGKIETSKASEVIRYVVKKSGIEAELLGGGEEDRERLENIKELATLALKYDPPPDQSRGRAGNLPPGAGIEKLLEDAALMSDQDELSSEHRAAANTVKLMTVHASKGLEFKYVFITGLEDGLFPHERRENESSVDQEEERRLFYVALTRAKEKLFLSFANFRTIFGSRTINAPSEFLADIPAELLELEGEKHLKTIYLD